MPETKDDSLPILSTMTMGMVHPDNALRMIFGVAQQVANVFSAPVEMLLRPKFGSQYLHPITVILSWILLQVFVVISFVVHMSANALHKPLHGWLGMGMLITSFDLGFIYHLIRVRKLMLDMSKEEDSETEGPALLFFSRLPQGQGWARVRVFYEPAVVFFGAIGLCEFGFFDGVATFYLVVASFALCAKNALRWYQGWEYLRKVFNNQNRSKILSEILTGKSKTQTVGGFVLAGLPTNTPVQFRVEVARSMTGLTPELDQLVTPVGKA